MAEASHLERMGRELKCPICLSLLCSAVSLTCNHVFCNSCIEKSMKASSSCPVCKVPYRRREIRPASHMDNLVSIYKSMEVASGVNIFVTQTADSIKNSGEDNQTGGNIHEVHHIDQTQVEVFESGNKEHKKKGSKSASLTKPRSSESNLVKPSFPTKKRVQVPQYTTSGTDLEHKNLEARIGETGRNESKNWPVLQKDMPVTCAQREPIFSPFFWLREEEDLEKLSQQTDDNQIMYTPPEAPCFSDIKDSDDEADCQKPPERGTRILSDNADFIDSEMFEWTQRPCSPELCSSPLAIENEHTAEENKAQTKRGAALTETKGIKTNSRKRMDKRRMDKASDSQCRMGIYNMEDCEAEKPRKNKRAKRTACEVTAVDTDLGKATYQNVLEGNKDSQLDSKGKLRKGKTFLLDASVEEKIVLTVSDETEPPANSNGTASAHVFASEDLEKSRKVHSKLKKSGNNNINTRKIPAQPQKFGNDVETQKLETGKGCISTEQPTECLISQSHTNLSLLGNGRDVSYRSIKRTNNKKYIKMPNAPKKVIFSVEDISKDNDDGILDANDEDTMRSINRIQGARDQLEMEVPVKNDKSISSLNGCVLLKCNTSFSTTHCAFCQSSEVSEASGVMVHYLRGKPVADDQNAIKSAIHVHRNCVEWAPNVYFEDDNVVNLETELSRSRRIRCSCCGIKGAALGCYEKSCRKSFHVTCARLTPECRWDYENFVMLCPIHTLSQLPNEMPQSQSRQKRKSSTERKPYVHEDKVKITGECKTRTDLQWNSKKKLKDLVLCCSALTNTEKELVAEFEKLTGITILKNWEPIVTHVIASIDKNEACRRTLKFLMGILEGKWILSVHWIKACIEAGELVDEQQYEISVDIHGITDGPKLGRLRLLNKQPKLFDGYTFYFMGDFTPSYKGYLHNLVIAAGGKVLNRKPVAKEQAIPLSICSATTVVVYSTELLDDCMPSSGNSVLDHRCAQAEALATSAGAIAVSNSWIMNSIAGSKLQKKIGE